MIIKVHHIDLKCFFVFFLFFLSKVFYIVDIKCTNLDRVFMTPFGLYLENLRRSRRIQQKQLADLMGINPCYVSTLERGRKGPPSAEVLNRLIKNLNLSRDEQEGLWRAAELSEMTFRLPEGMSQDEFEMVHDLRNHLGTLNEDQVLIIRKVLGLGVNSQEGIAM
ncbi:helix-turn-helix transcriptional regulator [Aeromonas veronii]|uniref:helix-turn-helix domain-containing protein n=1 Tax=Aeromonas veronii TaxID=654 RepID=UPI0019156438|nr:MULTISPECIES: helix-turn-helix transcriptional regulator [Aeromonas]MCX0424185.1 helix-turn-helix domain-containing protein [Aeromonas veronii]WIJ43347.1 helix-turn-helix transcriptional regulator [Aeromonas veronii]BCO11650.1 hypothetical protein RIMD111065_00060 [Aeromonas hydrophila]